MFLMVLSSHTADQKQELCLSPLIFTPSTLNLGRTRAARILELYQARLHSETSFRLSGNQHGLRRHVHGTETGSDRETISNQISCMTQITAERLSALQLTQTWSVPSCSADVLLVSSDCLRDPKPDWLIKGSQSLPLHLCARKVH